MHESHLKSLFLADGRSALSRLISARRELAGSSARQSLDQCFRLLHSLKSEASHLGYSSLAAWAERLEDRFTALRRDPDRLEAERPTLLNALEDFQRDLASFLNGLELELSAADGKEELTDFDLDLVSESQARGEVLFQAVCRTAADEPLPYARLYLVVSVLEQAANLIKTVPSLETLASGQSREMRAVFTSGRDETELRRLLSADGIVSVELSRVEAPALCLGVDKGDEEAVALNAPSATVMAGRSALAEAELNLQRALLTAGTGDTVSSILRARGVLERFLSLSWEPLVRRLEMTVVRTAAALGKEAVLLPEGQMRALVRPEVHSAVSEVLGHLVRNAVDHGLEPAAERRACGKPDCGTLRLSFEEHDGKWTLRLADDGRGIDGPRIYETAAALGLDLTGRESLFGVLSHPGFSTTAAVSAVSGRGVGLDIVRETVTNALRGVIDVETRPGQGSTFILRFDAKEIRHRAYVLEGAETRLRLPHWYVREFSPWMSGNAGEEAGTAVYRYRGVAYRLSGASARDEDGYAVLVQTSAGRWVVHSRTIPVEEYCDLDEIDLSFG